MNKLSKNKTNPGPSENELQAAFFQWIDYVAVKNPEVALCFSIPNGSHKSPAARALFRRTGLRPGVPDVCLPLPSRIPDLDYQYHGLFIEFKSKRGAVSEAQKLWIDALRKAGHRVEICRDMASAANVVIEYLSLKVSKV